MNKEQIQTDWLSGNISGAEYSRLLEIEDRRDTIRDFLRNCGGLNDTESRGHFEIPKGTFHTRINESVNTTEYLFRAPDGSCVIKLVKNSRPREAGLSIDTGDGSKRADAAELSKIIRESRDKYPHTASINANFPYPGEIPA